MFVLDGFGLVLMGVVVVWVVVVGDDLVSLCCVRGSYCCCLGVVDLGVVGGLVVGYCCGWDVVVGGGCVVGGSLDMVGIWGSCSCCCSCNSCSCYCSSCCYSCMDNWLGSGILLMVYCGSSYCWCYC